MPLRNYQNECLEEIERRGNGNWLIQMATGLGKGHILPHIKYEGKTLIIQHREELIEQNAEGFQNVGIEKARQEAGQAPVVCASIQTLLNRKEKFKPNEFHTIVIDECHRYGASKWLETIQYFEPKRILGFTATPNRSDGKGLDKLFDDIIFERDIRFGIENGWLAPLHCERVNVGYDVSGVAKRMGDFAVGELEKAVNIQSANEAIAQVFKEAPKPAIIFCVNVEHANALAEICGIRAITQDTKKRAEILQEFKKGNLEGICNVNILTEGVNLNNEISLIGARPTESELFFIQMLGRILRLHETKTKAYFYDCVGVTGKHSLCGAHTLLGLDLDSVPESERIDVYGDLLEDLPNIIEEKSEDPRTFIQNREIVKLFEKRHKLKLYGLNFVKHPDGSLIIGLGGGKWIGITKIDHLKRAKVISNSGKEYPLTTAQESIDSIVTILNKHCKNEKQLWDYKAVRKWGKKDISQMQYGFAMSLLKEKGWEWFRDDLAELNKEEASTLISRLKWMKAKNG